METKNNWPWWVKHYSQCFFKSLKASKVSNHYVMVNKKFQSRQCVFTFASTLIWTALSRDCIVALYFENVICHKTHFVSPIQYYAVLLEYYKHVSTVMIKLHELMKYRAYLTPAYMHLHDSIVHYKTHLRIHCRNMKIKVVYPLSIFEACNIITQHSRCRVLRGALDSAPLYSERPHQFSQFVKLSNMHPRAIHRR